MLFFDIINIELTMEQNKITEQMVEGIIKSIDTYTNMTTLVKKYHMDNDISKQIYMNNY